MTFQHVFLLSNLPVVMQKVNFGYVEIFQTEGNSVLETTRRFAEQRKAV